MNMKMKQLRVATTINDIYRFLEYLDHAKPFKDTMNIAAIVNLQEQLLFKVTHPDLISVGEGLEPKWTLMKEFSSYNQSLLTVRVITNRGNVFDFVVMNKIRVFSIDSNYCRISIGECDEANQAFDMIFSDEEDEVEAVMEDFDAEDEVVVPLKELPFNFKRSK